MSGRAPARRALCTMAHGPHLELLEMTAPVLSRYAERYGYDAIVLRHRLDPSRPPSWDKVLLLRALVRRYDLVVWIDADAVVVDDAPDIGAALRPRRFLHLVEHHIDHQRVPNAGVLTFTGGRRSALFLDRVWAERRFVNHQWWENAAMLHLLGYRDVLGMRPALPSPWRLGLGLLDKRWNSIPADPAPRPHIVHFAALPFAERVEQVRALTA
jgi:hypothetical protein